MSAIVTQFYIMIIMGTREGLALIPDRRKNDVSTWIHGYLKSHGHTPVITNGTENHLHIFLKMKDDISLDSLVKEIRVHVSRQYKRRFPGSPVLAWNKDYAAFSYSPSHVREVVAYIQNEAIHHQRMSYEEEFLKFLTKHEIKHDPKKVFPYLFPSEKQNRRTRIRKVQAGMVLSLF
jgi:REP element-mobilizing transposase RayT